MKDRIAESGHVTGFKGGMTLVRLEGGHACRKCGMAAMGLCRPGGTGMVLRAENPLGAEVGQKVRVDIREAARARGYLLAYIMPLVAFVGGGLMGMYLGGQGLSALLAFVSMMLTALVTYSRIRTMDRNERLYISRILHDVPDFSPAVASSCEGEEYLRAMGR